MSPARICLICCVLPASRRTDSSLPMPNRGKLPNHGWGLRGPTLVDRIPFRRCSPACEALCTVDLCAWPAGAGSDEQIFGQEQQVRLGAKRLRNECANQWVLDAMTLQEAKSIVRHLGLTLRKVRSGSYRVNFHNGNEGTAPNKESHPIHQTQELLGSALSDLCCRRCSQPVQ